MPVVDITFVDDEAIVVMPANARALLAHVKAAADFDEVAMAVTLLREEPMRNR